jgi:hypothetical protein
MRRIPSHFRVLARSPSNVASHKLRQAVLLAAVLLAASVSTGGQAATGHVKSDLTYLENAEGRRQMLYPRLGAARRHGKG